MCVPHHNVIVTQCLPLPDDQVYIGCLVLTGLTGKLRFLHLIGSNFHDQAAMALLEYGRDRVSVPVGVCMNQLQLITRSACQLSCTEVSEHSGQCPESAKLWKVHQKYIDHNYGQNTSLQP